MRRLPAEFSTPASPRRRQRDLRSPEPHPPLPTLQIVFDEHMSHLRTSADAASDADDALRRDALASRLRVLTDECDRLEREHTARREDISAALRVRAETVVLQKKLVQRRRACADREAARDYEAATSLREQVDARERAVESQRRQNKSLRKLLATVSDPTAIDAEQRELEQLLGRLDEVQEEVRRRRADARRRDRDVHPVVGFGEPRHQHVGQQQEAKEAIELARLQEETERTLRGCERNEAASAALRHEWHQWLSVLQTAAELLRGEPRRWRADGALVRRLVGGDGIAALNLLDALTRSRKNARLLTTSCESELARERDLEQQLLQLYSRLSLYRVADDWATDASYLVTRRPRPVSLA